jgi:hypothetical protein
MPDGVRDAGVSHQRFASGSTRRSPVGGGNANQIERFLVGRLDEGTFRRHFGTMLQHWVACGRIWYYEAASADKLTTNSSAHLSCMSQRKPKLDWIKQVLADTESVAGRARPGPIEIVRGRETASADIRLIRDRRERPDDDDRPVCASWQLMRFAAAQKS